MLTVLWTSRDLSQLHHDVGVTVDGASAAFNVAQVFRTHVLGVEPMRLKGITKASTN